MLNPLHILEPKYRCFMSKLKIAYDLFASIVILLFVTFYCCHKQSKQGNSTLALTWGEQQWDTSFISRGTEGITWFLSYHKDLLLPLLISWEPFLALCPTLENTIFSGGLRILFPEGIMLSEISQMEKDKYCMVSLICGIVFKSSKWTNKTKQRPTHRYREQIGGYQRGKGVGKGKMGKGSQLYGDRWKLYFWWWAHCSVYRSQIRMLYTWNLYDFINQCYLN